MLEYNRAFTFDMVNFCAVVGCGNRANREKTRSFYRLPAIVTGKGEALRELTERRRRAWLVAINRKDIKESNLQYTRVCSDHFISGKPSDVDDDTNPDWVPSRNMGYSSKHCPTPERYERAQRRSKRPRLNEEDVADPDESVFEDEEAAEQELVSGEEVQTVLMCADIQSLEGDLAQLRATVSSKQNSFTKEEFQSNDKKVSYFTGLPNWEIFAMLLDYVGPALFKGNAALNPFQQLLLTLARLRLNLPVQFLAYLFGVHKSTVSRVFSHTLDVLFIYLKHLIVWPEREVLLATRPLAFVKHCPTCVAVIDCFEIFLERPTNLLARAQTFSTYKHHNTVKYLIAITPQGSISFISEGWGGRVSDKRLTESSCLLHNLLPGDTILADRGFDIQESVGLYCARVTTPAWTRGKSQLDGVSVEQTRRIANVRIHVERLIGLLRQKFQILSATQPIDTVMSKDQSPTTLDKMVYVCCCLVNMCNSVVPFD